MLFWKSYFVTYCLNFDCFWLLFGNFLDWRDYVKYFKRAVRIYCQIRFTYCLDQLNLFWWFLVKSNNLVVLSLRCTCSVIFIKVTFLCLCILLSLCMCVFESLCFVSLSLCVFTYFCLYIFLCLYLCFYQTDKLALQTMNLPLTREK